MKPILMVCAQTGAARASAKAPQSSALPSFMRPPPGCENFNASRARVLLHNRAVMTWNAQHAETIALLTPEARARLPLHRLVLLFLNPFSLFADASQGSAAARERALSFNRAMRWMLLSYLKRWLVIAASSFIAIAPTEALAAQAWYFKISSAAFAVGCCIAITVIACTVAAYVLLGGTTRESCR